MYRPLLLLACISLGCGSCRDQSNETLIPRSAPLPSEAFVWQRVWTPEVGTAVDAASGTFAALHLLIGEIRLNGTVPVTTRIVPDWTKLRQYKGRIGAVIRIHASIAKLRWNEAAFTELLHLLSHVSAQFKAEKIPLDELQLDYDCPESKLGDYTNLIRRLKHAEAAPRICITALPTWLHQPDVAALLRESPSYVLQVHSLHLPKRGQPASLLDQDEVSLAITRAANMGVPFRLALPTYSCVLLYDEKGNVSEVYGEDAPANLPLKSQNYVVLDSDAFTIEKLITDLRKHAPNLMEALIWYRLPVANDRLNWPASTLTKLVNSEPLKRGWKGDATLSSNGHLEINIHHTGDAPSPLPSIVTVDWSGPSPDACDGVRGYGIQSQAPGRLILRLLAPTRQLRIPPAGKSVIGWLRLPDEANTANIRVTTFP